MALTAADLGYVRDAIGDSDTTAQLTTDTLDAIYDSAAQGNGSVDRTIVFALRRLRGKLARLTAKSGDNGLSDQQQQWFEHLGDLLTYYEGLAGMTGGQTIGTTATHAYRADSLQTEEPDYTSTDDD